MSTLSGGRAGRLLAGLWLVLLALSVASIGQTADEYAVKAAFLFNFTKFVEWPPAAAGSDFDICILGDDPFGSTMDAVTAGKSVGGSKIRVRKLKEPAEASSCRIVFVRSQEWGRAARLHRNRPGQACPNGRRNSGVVRLGGTISLVAQDGRVDLLMNAEALETGSLKFSAKLMSVMHLY